jgi:RNA polymerase sigma-70 factor, ECF subfamily
VVVDALRGAFLAELEPSVAARMAAWPGLDAELSRLWAEGTAALSIALPDPARFGAQLASGVDADAEPDQGLGAIFAADLAMACACAAGHADAIALFEAEFARDLDLAHARGGGHVMPKDEFRQRVRERLFVAVPGRELRIAAYGGRGSLRSWVRVTAARVLIDAARKATPPDAPANDTRLFDRVADRDDPELDYMRATYGAVVPEAMRVGLATLTARQRNLLRQRYLFDMSTDRLAIMYSVHRATAFRWLEEARVALFAGMRQALGERLKVAEHELDGVIELLASRVDVSVRRLLDSRLEE